MIGKLGKIGMSGIHLKNERTAKGDNKDALNLNKIIMIIVIDILDNYGIMTLVS